MENSIKQLTVRLPEKVYEDTKKEAEEVGASHNSYLMMLIHLGRKIHNGDAVINLKDN